MRQFLPAVALLSLAVAVPTRSHAQDSTKAPSVEAAVGTSVAEKALVGAAESFPAGTAVVFCFAKITGAADSEVEFAWYKGDTEIARVKQAVRTSPYRTWTSKKMPADAKGDWHCDVEQAGKKLTSVKFSVQ
jgi:hypothetical protein